MYMTFFQFHLDIKYQIQITRLRRRLFSCNTKSNIKMSGVKKTQKREKKTNYLTKKYIIILCGFFFQFLSFEFLNTTLFFSTRVIFQL